MGNPSKRKKLYRIALLNQNAELKKEIEGNTVEELALEVVQNLEQPALEIVEEQPIEEQFVVKSKKKKSVE